MKKDYTDKLNILTKSFEEEKNKLEENLSNIKQEREHKLNTIQLYDAFTINTLLFLEDLGFCKKGEAIELVKNNNIGPDGTLRVNTNGGGLSCVHPGMYGLFVTLEAIRQLRNSSGDDVGKRLEGGWINNAKLSIAHGNGGVLSSQVTNIWGVSETF